MHSPSTACLFPAFFNDTKKSTEKLFFNIMITFFVCAHISLKSNLEHLLPFIALEIDGRTNKPINYA